MIEKWLRARFFNVKLTTKDWRVDCPFCFARHGRADTKAHLYVSILKPVAHCFRCDWSGHYVSLVMGVEGCQYSEALQYIQEPPPDLGRFDIEDIFSPMGLVKIDHLIEYPEGYQPLSHFVHDREYGAVRNYLVHRFGRRRAIHFYKERDDFGWCPGTNRLWIVCEEGYWQGRAIDNSEPKYINPPWPVGDCLWNGHILDDHSIREIIVCEGVFSAVCAGDIALAILGKTPNKLQVRRLAKSRKRRITIMLDADANENAFSFAHYLELAGYGGQIIIHALFRGDPCDGLRGDTISYGFDEIVKVGLT